MSKPCYLYVTPFFPSPERWRGGFSFDAVRALERIGKHRIMVLKPGSGEDYEYQGVRVHTFRRVVFPFGLAPFLLAWLNARLFQRKLRQLGISLGDIGVCHAHAMECAEYAAFLAKKAPRIRTIIQSHQMGAPFNLFSGRLCCVPFHADLLYLFYRRLFERADCVVLLSELHRRQFGLTYPGGPLKPGVDVRKTLVFGRFLRAMAPKRIEVVYNGIDSAVFNPVGRQPHSGFVIGCVANFNKTKDQLTLLRAVRRLVESGMSDLSVRLIGSGPELGACQRFVAEHALDGVVTFEKEIDHLALPDFYRSLDLFVLPTWQEGFSCTLIEAAGCGTPIMSCRGTSIEEVVPRREWDKWLISPEDDDGLARMIERYRLEAYVFAFNQSLDIDVLVRDFYERVVNN